MLSPFFTIYLQMKKPSKKEIRLIFQNYNLKAFSLKKIKDQLYLNCIYPADAEYYRLKYNIESEIEITRLYRQKGADIESYDIVFRYDWNMILDSADRESFNTIEQYILTIFDKYPEYIKQYIPHNLPVLYEK